ncbi:MAG: hypothetical protein AB1486_16605 [Planctomycetota bacterium]
MSASTQNQALAPLLFLYRLVLKPPLPGLQGLVRAEGSQHVPVVMTREGISALSANMNGTSGLMARLL